MKHFKFLCLILLVVFLVSCEKEYNLSSRTANLLYSEEIQSDTIIINGSNGKCELEYSPEWITPEISDSIVKVNVKANSTNAPREDLLIIKCGKSNISFPVKQYSKATKLILPNGKDIKISREGGSQELAVVSDGLVKIYSPDKIKAEWNNDLLKVSSSSNEGHRIKDKIILKSGEFTEEVNVVIDGDVCTICSGNGYVKCKSCGGKGYIDEFWDWRGCKSCGGRGISERAGNFNFKKGSGKVKCSSCNGEG